MVYSFLVKLIDTHAHLQFEKFDTDRSDVIKRNGEELEAVINPGASIDSSKKGVEMVQNIANFYAAVGVHPHHVDQWDKETMDQLEYLVKKPKVVAVGEIGLDKHTYQGYPEPNLNKQIEILIPQIELARKFDLPILFHCRDAYDDLYKTIEKFKPLRGLLHCFMGDKDVAKKFVGLGLKISFAGNLTYKGNDKMRDAAKYLSNDLIVTETDSPYLSPENLRGTRNEPINVKFVAETIAQVKHLGFDEVGEFTVKNAKNLFDLEKYL